MLRTPLLRYRDGSRTLLAFANRVSVLLITKSLNWVTVPTPPRLLESALKTRVSFAIFELQTFQNCLPSFDFRGIGDYPMPTQVIKES